MNDKPKDYVLGIVGSPRRDGNTDRLVDSVLRGAAMVGWPVEKVRLSEFDVRPCEGCLACYPGGLTRCAIHDDDMQRIVDRMERARLWILGTPVYCYGPVGQLKVFIDRWICLLPRVYSGTRAATVIPLHAAASGADPTLALLETLFRGFGLEHLGSLVCPDLLHVEDLDRHTEYVYQAVAFGRRLGERLLEYGASSDGNAATRSEDR